MKDGDRENARLVLTTSSALTLLAFGLRLVDLDRLPLWEDEAATWWFATTLDGSAASHARVEPTPPLHFLLVAWVYRWFGQSDFWLRLPSAIFGALSVGAAYLLGRRLVSSRAGFWAALWLAVHPWQVFVSREARVYPLLLLLTLLLWWLTWRALEEDRIRDWIAASTCLALALWSHFYGLFAGLTFAIAVWAAAPSRRARWRGTTAAVVAGLTFAPYLVLSVPHLHAGGSAWSVARIHEMFPEVLQPASIAEGHAIGARRNVLARGLFEPLTPELIWLPALLAQTGLVLVALVAFFGPSGLGRPPPEGGPPVGREARRRGLYLLSTWLLPVLLPWGISYFYRPIFHPGRHDFYVLGLTAIFVGTGCATLGRWAARPGRFRIVRRSAVAATLLVVVLAAAFRLAWIHVQPADEAPRLLGSWLARHAGRDTPILATGIRRTLAERYMRLEGGGAPIESFPASTDDHPGWADPALLLAEPKALEAEAEARLERHRSLPGEPSRLWVLPRRYPEDPAVRRRAETWLVDKHLFHALAAAGYRPVDLDLPASLVGQVLAFDPPEAVVSPRRLPNPDGEDAEDAEEGDGGEADAGEEEIGEASVP